MKFKNKVAILTRDFRILHRCTEILKELEFPYVVLENIDKIERYSVLLTTENLPYELPIIVLRLKDEEIDVRRAITYALVGGTFRNVSIGIDPGERIGMAIIGNGIVLEKRNIHTVDEVLEIINVWIEGYPSQYYKIKIGNGSPHVRNEIIKRIFGLAEIEIVNEDSTTTTKEDYDSAIKIARMEGKTLKTIPEIRIKKGNIKDLQRISRIKSNGKITISRKLAHEVLNGNITIEEAIKKFLKN